MDYARILPITTDIALDSVCGLSTLRNIFTVANNGAISATGSEIILSSNTTANGTASLSTATRISSYPGWDTFTHIGIRMPTAPTGEQVALWGVYDDDEGYGFGIDATSYFVFIKTGGVLTKTYQANWEIDKLDGTGVSALNLTSTSAGIIFQIRSTWYCGVEYGLFRPSAGMEQADAHRIKLTQPMYLTPYLPIRVEVQNNATTTGNLQVAVSIRKACQVAQGVPDRRPVSHSRTAVAITHGVDTPIVSLRRKTGATVPVKLSAVEVVTDQPMELMLVSGSTISSASWGDPNGIPVDESQCEVDDGNAQAVVKIVYRTLVPAGLSTIDIDPEFVPPTEQNPVSVYANVFGTTDATASFNLRWHENW